MPQARQHTFIGIIFYCDLSRAPHHAPLRKNKGIFLHFLVCSALFVVRPGAQRLGNYYGYSMPIFFNC